MCYLHQRCYFVIYGSLAIKSNKSCTRCWALGDNQHHTCINMLNSSFWLVKVLISFL